MSEFTGGWNLACLLLVYTADFLILDSQYFRMKNAGEQDIRQLYYAEISVGYTLS